MSEAISQAGLGVTPPAAHDPHARLTPGAACWSLFEGALNPYVILITICIFMPYVAQTVVGDPARGQEVISRWSQYSGWAVMATAPLLGDSIGKLGRRKVWLALIVALMVALTAALWFTRADHSGLSATQTLMITTTVGTLFTWSEVLHNSLLVRAAGLSAAHIASGLALALGNVFGLAALAFTAWAFALPGTATSWLGPFLVNQGTRLFKTQHGGSGFATVTLLLFLGFAGLVFVRGGDRPDAPRSSA